MCVYTHKYLIHTHINIQIRTKIYTNIHTHKHTLKRIHIHQHKQPDMHVCKKQQIHTHQHMHIYYIANVVILRVVKYSGQSVVNQWSSGGQAVVKRAPGCLDHEVINIDMLHNTSQSYDTHSLSVCLFTLT